MDARTQLTDWQTTIGALAPTIAASTDEIERTRRLPAALMGALHDAGLFRLFLPRRYGGAEADPLAFMHALEAIAAHDASTAWNIGQNAVCAIVAAYLEPEAAREIFGPRDAILAWGPQDGPARALACEGGYRVSGRWSFASGMRHATWLGGMCTVLEADGSPRPGPQGRSTQRIMLFPAREAKIRDVWDVIGLRGTASDAYAVENLFVPQAYTVDRETTAENREPGWLYTFSIHNLFSCGFGSVAIGVARAMLDAFVELAKTKTPRGMPSRLRDNAVLQSDLGRAEARLRAARQLLYGTMTEICAAVQAERRLSMDQRMAIRLAATQAIQEARAVGDFAYEAAGATAIFAANPFERRFRDLHAISQQLQGRASHYETVGRHLLGVDGETPFV